MTIALPKLVATSVVRGSQPGQEHLPGGFIRLSVGIEAVEELRADLEQAISKSC